MAETVLSMYLMNYVPILIFDDVPLLSYMIIQKDGILVYTRLVLVKYLRAAQKGNKP